MEYYACCITGSIFAVPVIVNHYPRAWKPDYEPVSPLSSTAPQNYPGRYFDPLGNRFTMVRHSNPDSCHVPLNKVRKR